MEKAINNNSKINLRQIVTIDPLKNKSSKPHPLGGVYLYNEQYQRHISKKQQLQINKCTYKMHDAQYTNNEIAEKILQNQYLQETKMKSTLDRQVYSNISTNGHMIAEIQNIIKDLSHSQVNTALLLEQVRKNKNQEEFDQILSFQELFSFFKNKNTHCFSNIAQKIQKEFKQKVKQQIQKIKRQEQLQHFQSKIKVTLIDQETQTNADVKSIEIQLLRKQLNLKNIDYEVLYRFKGQNDIFSNEIQQKFQQQLHKKERIIKHLQQYNYQKNMQSKKVRNQLKNVQDSLMSKIIQLQQRQGNALAKSSLQMIEEDYFREDIENTKRQHILDKKNYQKRKQKKRTGSLLLTSQNSFGHKIKNLISSTIDFDVMPKSAKQINIVTQRGGQNQYQSRYSASVYRQSKRSPSKMKNSDFQLNKKHSVKSNLNRNAVKNERYINLNQFKDNKNNKGHLRNISVSKLLSQIQKDLLFKKELQKQKRLNNFPKKNRQSHNIFPQKFKQPRRVVTRTSQQANFSPNNKVSMFNALRTQQRSSVQTKYQCINHDKQEPPIQLFQERSAKKMQTNNQIKGDVGTSKKLKKGVSVHFVSQDYKNKLIICSNQINISIVNSGKLQASPSRLFKELKNVKDKFQVFQKPRLQTMKLTKGKQKHRNHFKAVSQLQQMTNGKKYPSEQFEDQQKYQPNDLNSLPTFNNPGRFSSYSPWNQQQQQNTSNFQSTKYSMKKQSSLAQSKQQQLDRKAKSLALKCFNKEHFHRQFTKIHKNCGQGQNCNHLVKYLQNFQKMRHVSTRPALKLGIQNVNSHIRNSHPNPSKAQL